MKFSPRFLNECHLNLGMTSIKNSMKNTNSALTTKKISLKNIGISPYHGTGYLAILKMTFSGNYKYKMSHYNIVAPFLTAQDRTGSIRSDNSEYFNVFSTWAVFFMKFSPRFLNECHLNLGITSMKNSMKNTN